jgi:phage terminase small subunit
MRRLTAKQERFVLEYLVDFNGAQAAIRAGYSQKGARQAAYRLLSNDYISQCIEEKAQAHSQRLGLQRDDVISALLASIALAEREGRLRQVIAGWREIARLLNLYPAVRKRRYAARPKNQDLTLMKDADLVSMANGYE